MPCIHAPRCLVSRLGRRLISGIVQVAGAGCVGCPHDIVVSQRSGQYGMQRHNVARESVTSQLRESGVPFHMIMGGGILLQTNAGILKDNSTGTSTSINTAPSPGRQSAIIPCVFDASMNF